MRVQTFSVRLRRNRTSYADILAEDPVLLYGEMVFVYDIDGCIEERMKMGNGRDPFSALPWYTDVDKIDKEAIGVPGGLVPLNSDGVVSENLIPEDMRIPIDPPTVESVAYTGELQSPAIYVDTVDGQILTGTLTGTEVGDYMIAAKPASGYKWTDGTTDTVFLPWSIDENGKERL